MVAATGQSPEVPERLRAALAGTERYESVGNDIDAVRAFVRRAVGVPLS